MNDRAIVVGGGLLGSAIGLGLVRAGLDVSIYDEGDDAFRAARGNFGLISVQAKGIGNPAYHRWSRESVDLWPAFAAELEDRTGIDLHHARSGALTPCVSQRELEARVEAMAQIKHEAGNYGFEYQILDRAAALELVPDLGPSVVGGVYTAYDGHCSPLALFRSLHAAFLDGGGQYVPGARVRDVRKSAQGFEIDTPSGRQPCDLLVIAAGLGCAGLGPMVGLNVPVAPNRGQILVTERTDPRLAVSLGFIRQTGEGSFMMGYSEEDVGFDDRTSPAVLAETASQAVAILPLLEQLRVVRTWAALRVLTPDGFPIYQQSNGHPGAFVATSHSGVTLAAAHVLKLAPAIAAGTLPDDLNTFTSDRFDVPPAG